MKRVNGDYISYGNVNNYGGFPFGLNADTQEVFQNTINDPSSGSSMLLQIVLDFECEKYFQKWFLSLRFNFYATDGTTTYYLQKTPSDDYYWVDSSVWNPLGPTSPRIGFRGLGQIETAVMCFNEEIELVDKFGQAVVMQGTWDFFLDVEPWGNSSQNQGPMQWYVSYGLGSFPVYNPAGGAYTSGQLQSGYIKWSNTTIAVVPLPIVNTITSTNAGTPTPDVSFVTSSPFLGQFLMITSSSGAVYGTTINLTNITGNNNNTEVYTFGQLIFGDSLLGTAPGSLQVYDGTTTLGVGGGESQMVLSHLLKYYCMSFYMVNQQF